MSDVRLDAAAMILLARYNTPAVCNGWEQISALDAASAPVNRRPLLDFTPALGPIAGRAVTVVIQPSNGDHPRQQPEAWKQYRRYVASVPGPKVVVVQDLDQPYAVGAFWGEVNSGFHRALGCLGTVIDGAVRDLDEMRRLGFKALARQTCVSHAFSHPIRWNEPVEVFGCTVSPGQLIHADQHGFLAVPPEDEARLLAATRAMDDFECQTMIASAKQAAGLEQAELLDQFDRHCADFGACVRTQFGRAGEFAPHPDGGQRRP